MYQQHYFVRKNRSNGIMQRIYLKDVVFYLDIIDDEINCIKQRYPTFNITYQYNDDSITFCHNNTKISRELADNIKLKLSLISNDKDFITISL